MDTSEFEAQLHRDGYLEIKHRLIDRGLDTRPHSHPFDTRLLVLEGETTIVCGGAQRTYRAGDIVEIDAGVEHCERYGAARVGLVAGLRHKPAGPSPAATVLPAGETPQNERPPYGDHGG